MRKQTEKALEFARELEREANAGSEWPELGDPFARSVPAAFPLDVLPEGIRAYVDDQARRMGADHGMSSMFAIVAAASAIDERIKVQPKSGDPSWTESVRLWVAVVGAPSIMKTPTLKAMTIPVREKDMEWRDAEQQQARRAGIERKIYNKKLSQYVDAMAKGEPATEPEPPQRNEIHRAVVEDITIEGLRDRLAWTNRGTLVHRNELSGFFGGMDAYRDRGVNKDGPAYLDLYDGGPLTVDRSSRSVFVANWGASIVGGIQPDPMRKIGGKLQDDGLLQRFNVILARDAVEDHDRTRCEIAYNAYSALIKALFDVAPEDGRIFFSDDARQVWNNFSTFTRGVQGVDLLPRKLRTHIGKWRGQFARYALLLHVVDCVSRKVSPYTETISDSTAKAVHVLFSKYLMPHAYTFYADVIEDSEIMDRARWIAGLILSRKLAAVDRRTVKMSYRAMRHATDWEIQAVMDALSLFGWVDTDDVIKPYRRWTVNPSVHSTFAEKAERERQERECARTLLSEVFQAKGP